MSDDAITQTSPWPAELEDLVRRLRYRPMWRFELRHIDRGQGSVGLTFAVHTLGHDSYHVERGPRYGVVHYFPVPPAAYNRASWQRWLLEQLLLVERHEACEFFGLGREDESIANDETVDRPYAPNHGPGEDPYIVHDYSTDERASTNFLGKVKAP